MPTPDLPSLGTTAVTVEADSAALDKAFEQDIPRKAREAGQKIGGEFADASAPGMRAAGERSGREYAGGFRSVVSGLFQGVGLAIGNFLTNAVIRVIRSVPRFARETVHAFEEQEAAATRLRATLATIGETGPAAFQKIVDRAKELQRETTAADDALIGATATLGTIARGLDADELADAQQAIVGIADTFLDGNLNAAAEAVGKAVAGTRNELGQYGITVDRSASQSEKLRQIIEQTGAAFEVAKANATTLEGRMTQLSNAFQSVKARIGALIVDFLDLTDNTGKATNAVERFDAFLEENRGGILRLGEVLKGLGGIALNAIQLVGDTIVALVASVHRTIIEFVNVAIGGLNLLIAGARKIPGVNIADIPTWNVERADELIAKARANIVQNFDEMVDAAKRMGTEIPPAAERGAQGVRVIGTASDDAAERVKALRSELDRLIRQGVDLSKPVSDVTILENRLAATGVTIVDLIPLAKRLGMTIEELASQIVAGGEGARELITDISDLGSAFETQQKALEAVNDGFDEHKRKEEEARRALERAIDSFARGARGVIDFADALGVLDDAAADTLRAITNLGEGLARIKTDPLGGGLQALGGAAQLIDTLSKPSPQSAAQERLQATLDRLAESIDELAQRFRDLPGTEQSGLIRFAALEAGDDIRQLSGELDRLGLTFTDLRRVADIVGLDISNLEGVLRGTSDATFLARFELFALQESIRQLADEAESFTERLKQVRLGFELFDIEDPAKRFAAIVDTAVEKAFGKAGKLTQERLTRLAGLDLTKPEDVAQARDTLRQIFKDAEAVRRGEIPRDAVFGDLTDSEFEQLLREANGYLKQIQKDTEAGLDVQTGGSTTQGGIFRGVSIGQGDALIALGQTEVAYLQDIAISARDFAGRPTEGALFGPINFGQPPASAPTGTTVPGQTLPPSGQIPVPTPPPIPRGGPMLATQNTQNYTISEGAIRFGNLTLPNVTDAESFARELSRFGGRGLARLIEADTRDSLENRGVM